jgi:hypothetical protein
MITDKSIQSVPFKTHVQSDGSMIGGISPASYNALTVPGPDHALLLSTSGNTDPQGKQYPAWMWYPAAVRPVLPNTGNCSATWRSCVSGNLSAINVNETDVIFVITGADGKKFKYNGSVQRQASQGYMVADKNGNWLPTGVNPGPFVADQQRVMQASYLIDTVGHTISVAQIVDGTVFAIPASLQKVPASAFPAGQEWPDGAYVQAQQGSMPSGLAWLWLISDIELSWW